MRLDLKTGVSVSIRPNFTGEEVGAMSVPAGAGGRGGGGGGGGRGGRGIGLRDRWDIPFIISPHSHTRLYIFGNHLMRSDDRGDTWKMLSGDLTRNIDRDTVPVMGKVWGPDAVGKNMFTDSYGTGTIDCRIAAEGRAAVSGNGRRADSDHGRMAASTGGRSISFPGIPDLTYVSGVFPSPQRREYDLRDGQRFPSRQLQALRFQDHGSGADVEIDCGRSAGSRSGVERRAGSGEPEPAVCGHGIRHVFLAWMAARTG